MQETNYKDFDFCAARKGDEMRYFLNMHLGCVKWNLNGPEIQNDTST